ncbi:hypothetical protein SELMODRAFT_417154 [Selaginella moellendorffii]|uniref:Bulb-type lectin domain-containing protein n=1 Tax=Selaginella moellendorffii TaxID=88036 RepID=D8S1J3_SELML|nr:hypothetical protein SELMODRAFT_417154 [Selaginella moellendorffii]
MQKQKVSQVAKALFLELIMLLTVTSEGKLYTIPDKWRIFMNNSLPEFQGGGRSGSYRLVSALPKDNPSSRPESLRSDDENLGLAFLNFNGSNKYYLALMFGTRNSSTAAPVWIANRNAPVSGNSMLAKTGGRLQLLDANGSVAWSPNESVAYIGIQNSGNLQLFDESETPVWSSFDRPWSALMPNQKLVTGQSVVSNKNASDPSEGSYIAEIQASGSVGYMSIDSKKKQPYMLWSFVGSQIGSPSVNCPGYRTALSFTPAGEMSMVYEPIRVGGNEQPCGSPLSGEIFPGNTTMRYFQLADDGTMVSYRRELANGSWELDSTSQFFPPPAPCGSYGLLEKGKQCQCLTNEANNSTTSALGSCAQPEWSSLANCSSRYETDFVTLAGASYFANTFNPPDRTGAAMQDCLEQCKSTCSCAAFFFDQALQNCFFIEDVLGSLTVDSNKTQQLFGFLKYQNYSRLLVYELMPNGSLDRWIFSDNKNKLDWKRYGMVLLELIGGRKNLDCSKMESPLSWYFPAWAMSEIRKGNTMQVVDPNVKDSADTPLLVFLSNL